MPIPGVLLDKKDRDLLSLLYQNSRMTFTEMGKKLRLSPSTVERRLKVLQENGAISLMFADVNLAKLGFKAYRLYFKFDSMDEETEKDVLALFDSFPRTAWGVICQGEYDVLWRIIAKDEIEVEDTANLMTERFGKKIIEKTIATTTYQTYLSWNSALGGVRHPELPLERVVPVETLDKIDMKILSILYGNARESTVNIAKAVGLTPDAVSYRMKKLTKDGFILGYTTWYDARKLGLEYYKIFISFRNITREKEKQFLGFCLAHNNVIYLNKTIGSWDIEVDVIVKDVVELHEFIRGMKTKFGTIMGKHTYISSIYERMLNPIKEFL